MRKRIRDRLRDRAGDSIAEVLIALLISSLGLLLLASMISISVDMVSESKSHFHSYIEAENVLAAQETGGEADTVQIKSAASAVQLTNETEDTIPILCYSNETIGGKPVVSYKVNKNAP